MVPVKAQSLCIAYQYILDVFTKYLIAPIFCRLIICCCCFLLFIPNQNHKVDKSSSKLPHHSRRCIFLYFNHSSGTSYQCFNFSSISSYWKGMLNHYENMTLKITLKSPTTLKKHWNHTEKPTKDNHTEICSLITLKLLSAIVIQEC